MSTLIHPAPQSPALPTTLRFVTYLAPTIYETYAAIASYIGEAIGYSTSLHVGQQLEEMHEGSAHIAFLCGLHYIRLKQATANHHTLAPHETNIELLAAP